MLRPFLPGLRLAAVFAAAILAAYVWIPHIRSTDTDTSVVRLNQAFDRLRADIGKVKAAASGKPGGHTAFARFDSLGAPVIWSDGFAPTVSGALETPLEGSLSAVFRDDGFHFRIITETDSGRVEYQSPIWPAQNGPFRMYATPIEGVSLYADQSEYLSPELRTREWMRQPGITAWLVTEQDAQAVSVWRFVWWSLVLVALFTVLMRFRAGVSDAWKPMWPILGLLGLPELLGWSGWLDMAAIWAGPLAEQRAISELWLRGLCYVYPAAVLVRTLLRAKRLYGLAWAPRTLAFSTLYGLVTGWGLIWLTSGIHDITAGGTIQVLGIDALPGSATILLYTGIGLMAAVILVSLLVTGWFLFNTETDHAALVHAGSALGFAIPVVFRLLADGSADDPALVWAVGSGVLLYGVSYWLHRRPDAFRSLSPFRQLLTGVLLLCAYLYPLLWVANQDRYETRMAEIAQLTARTGIPASDRLGLESPFRIVMYEDTVRVDITGDYISGQFVDRARLHPLYRELVSGGRLDRTVAGPYFDYRETAVRSGDRTAVVSIRIQNRYNHLFALFRLFFILMVLALMAYPLIRFASGDRMDLFRGRERFEHRVLDTYILSSFVFLLVLTFFTRQIILTQSERRLELDLMSRLDMLAELASEPDRMIAIAENTDLDLYRYEGPWLTDFGESVQIGGLPTATLLPYQVHQRLAQEGVDRATYRIDSESGPLLVAYRKIGPDQVLAMPANLNANKHVDEILQTTSLSIIVYVVIFGLFIGGAVLITRELMQPIHQFRRGLTRISAGQLDTLIPVTSRDEIGELANAYNLMVFKLKDLQDELADKERQTAWAEMARQVAHEIKNPLTPMKLSVQHLHQQVHYGQKSPDEIKDMIVRITDTLIREIESLNNIANDFSKFARPITEDFVDTDVNDTIRSILNLYQHDHRLYLWTDLDPRRLMVHAAPDELKRVILNLVKNAMEAIPAGGLVVIRTARFADSAWIEVIDNGSGISDDLKNRIFIPNFSTKSTGTGLGLAICRKVILAHKGEITFSSTPGTGTTFTIRLPLCDLT